MHPHLTPGELAKFTSVDHAEREAFVVLDGTAIVAVARFDRLMAGSDTAEVAFGVADEWQHHGVATDLFHILMTRARELGIHRFVAQTLAANRAMLTVFRHSGLPCTATREDGVVTVTMELEPTISGDLGEETILT